MAVNFFKKIQDSLARTRTSILGSLENILPFGAELTDDMLEEVEEVLYEADLGVHAAELMVEKLRERAGDIRKKLIDPYGVMKEAIIDIICADGAVGKLEIGHERPYVILVVGVNGTGKTTTIGKLSMRFAKEGHSVLLAACDTFRAAAIEQLGVWAERSGAGFVKSSTGADAAAVAYDAMMRARARSDDVVIVDTAGRLHTSKNLMEELKKIRKIIKRAAPEAPHETLLVLDATTGQNALSQAEIFKRELDVTGIVLTKLDGTAKGGIVVSIIDRLGIPVKLVGIGEGIEDLRDFDPEAYAGALLTN